MKQTNNNLSDCLLPLVFCLEIWGLYLKCSLSGATDDNKLE